MNRHNVDRVISRGQSAARGYYDGIRGIPANPPKHPVMREDYLYGYELAERELEVAAMRGYNHK